MAPLIATCAYVLEGVSLTILYYILVELSCLSVCLSVCHDVITHVHSRFGAHVFVFIFTSSGFEPAHSGTNSPHIDVAYVAQAK